MQFKKTTISALLFVLPFFLNAQSTYLPRGSKEYSTLDRLQIKLGKDTVLNFLQNQPFSRHEMVKVLEGLDSAGQNIKLTDVDRYNINDALMNSSEWVTGSKEGFSPKKPFLKIFYKNKANFFEVDNKDFYLSVNPVLQLRAGKENDNSSLLFVNTRGVVIRGLIAKRIGFQSYITDNQERPPMYVRNRIDSMQAVPGEGFYKPFKTTGYDYFDARGYITFNAAKFLDFQFGYDKNFIGDGYRSLVMSDNSNSYLFLRINTHVWRLNYNILYMELTNQFEKGAEDYLLPRKYAVIHHLNINAPKWLTLGVMDAIVFGRADHFDFSYLNPIIFLRAAEQQAGSPDNALIAFDVKANVAHSLQFYSMVLIDELKLSELKAGNGWWGNKFGVQVGAKYIDAFGLKNLDLQAEFNWVRPFTYTHVDSVANYTHYNQPLAHPVGANFREFVGIARYQPAPKWRLEGKIIAYLQGTDTAGMNFGNNIFLPYTTRAGEYGFHIGSAVPAKCVNFSLMADYEWKENFFIEATLVVRKYTGQSTNTIPSIGIRWNIARREYDY